MRQEADAAVQALGWSGPYFVDADHIGLKTVDRFLDASDFFTIDVADSIGQPAAEADIEAFVAAQSRFAGSVTIPGIERPLEASPERIAGIGRKYLAAVQEAGRIYRHIAAAKGDGKFVTEVSMDETDQPQTPVDLLFILAALAAEKVPLQTIAPKFTGRFNKGVDYVGDVAQFEHEFSDDLAVIAFAVREFGLPADLKLSVHSGSDKFSIYAPIRRTLRRTGAGLHLKTAGTTWLEEVIGLAAAGGDGLALAKEVYREALDHIDALCGPYAAVIDIDRRKLPSIEEVADWSGPAIRRRTAPRSALAQLQPTPATTLARRLQSRRSNGHALYRRIEQTRSNHRRERHRKSFRSPSQTAVHRRGLNLLTAPTSLESAGVARAACWPLEPRAVCRLRGAVRPCEFGLGSPP